METKQISTHLYNQLAYLGIINSEDVRGRNEGKSNYSDHFIQPWAIWLDYPDLTPWDDDILKRILREKTEKGMSKEDARILDYQKIIHICQERIRQLKHKDE